ncbi:signal peptide peptidase SppA [Altericista sp. CCNU0014]|uniref:signal peptide peptidase SppA n=1 Tax=Altericista sp. CCNU0014 TaxID=3082949 RepID=UPI00384E4DAC
MRLDRLLATLLIVICLVAAVGNWLWGASFQESEQNKTADIALIDVYGSISDTPSAGPFGTAGGSSANALLDAIQKARKDKVKAILLRINSPGGTAAAAQSVYHELMRVRKETSIKIVASLGDVAASGGYYIASAANHIVANPSTLTGSIGVVIRTQNVAGFLEKLGVQSSTVQSGQFKDILSPFRSATADERQIIQSIVSDSYEQFLASIVEGRGISLAELKKLADGRIFTGAQAKTVKLVDSLGNYQDAVRQTVKTIALKKEPNIRNYTQGSSGSLLGRLIQPFSMGPDGASELSVPSAGDWNKVPLALME